MHTSEVLCKLYWMEVVILHAGWMRMLVKVRLNLELPPIPLYSALFEGTADCSGI